MILLATFASIVDYDLKDNEAEDSYNLLPVLMNPNYKVAIREATVHHSLYGNFAIRKGDWKLIFYSRLWWMEFSNTR